METFRKLFSSLLVFVYHCFDRVVIQGYLPLLTRPEHIVYFFRDVHGTYPITKPVLRQRTQDYQHWVEAYARNHRIPLQWPDPEMKKKRPPTGRLRPSLPPGHGTAPTLWRLLHLPHHGTGLQLPFLPA